MRFLATAPADSLKMQWLAPDGEMMTGLISFPSHFSPSLWQFSSLCWPLTNDRAKFRFPFSPHSETFRRFSPGRMLITIKPFRSLFICQDLGRHPDRKSAIVPPPEHDRNFAYGTSHPRSASPPGTSAKINDQQTVLNHRTDDELLACTCRVVASDAGP